MHKSHRWLILVTIIASVVLWMQWTENALALSPAGMMVKSGSSDEKKTDAAPPDDLAKDQIDSIMAGMSDEQARQMLINELRNRASEDSKQASEKDSSAALMGKLDFIANVGSKRIMAVLKSLPTLPADIRYSVNLLTEGQGLARFFKMSLMVALILLAGILVETLERRLSSGFRKRVTSIPTLNWGSKLGSAVIKAMPDFFGIFVFALSSVIIYLVVYGSVRQPIRILFLAALIAALMARVLTALSRMLCSPNISQLRMMNLSDSAAQRLHSTLVRFFWIAAVLIMTDAFFSKVLLNPDSIIMIGLISGTLFILVIAVMVLQNRHAVAAVIRGCEEESCDESSWFKEQVAGIWHLMALAYLFLIWLVFSGRLIIFDPELDGAFIISLLIVPIYLLLDRIGMWIISTAMGHIEVVAAKGAEGASATAGDEVEDADGQATPTGAPQAPAVAAARRFMRLIIIMSLGFWMLRLWGISIPYGREITAASFDIFITLVLALGLWRLLSSFIERKLKASQPSEEELAAAEDDEWGGVAMDRSHTLLPMLRKFVGVTMMVLVSLIVLSSLGVDIGPLLAGAGVVGLAIGFGAQKLVSDVLSGVFFLLDDAFRVGEYIKGGSMSGSVEAITLRNVMLRHHRGMLQIVPFSDLGSITNFMRGGMVVKFNIELPYDTDIEKVRKVIKKVGKKMMTDPVLGPDFIKPVKSQGVRKVGDSVMTFRVKFTAHPGKHFVIRREAFRRITEALEAKGIYYAHRKVIVEMPELEHLAEEPAEIPPAASGADSTAAPPQTADASPETQPEPTKQELIKAGAAASLDTIISEEKPDKKKK